MVETKKVVVIEDSPDISRLIELFFARYTAYKLDVEMHDRYDFEPKDVDCYLCDHDVNGPITGSQWFKSHTYQQIPPEKRILMSGRHDVWVKEGIVGMVYLNKPFTMNQLYKALDEVLGK